MEFANTNPAPYISAAYLLSSTILVAYAIFIIRGRRQLRLLRATIEPKKSHS